MKSFFGKSFLGIVRTTFWIGPDGTIRKVWPLNVKGHADEALAAIREVEAHRAYSVTRSAAVFLDGIDVR